MKNWKHRLIMVVAGMAVACMALLLPVKSSVAQSILDPFPGIIPVLPTPFELVSNLDLSCHRVKGGETPVDALEINHLNPVLQEMGFKSQKVYLGQLEQLCVPVAKNQVIPPGPTLSIARWIDLACYEAKSEEGESVVLGLSHLNPVLRKMGLPPYKVKMAKLNQMCVPVAKNGVMPPDYVRRIVEHVDVACYEIYPYEETKEFKLNLTHLNPVLLDAGLKEQDVVVVAPEQLCVPVAKNGKMPPKDVLRYVSWIDFSKYSAFPMNDTKTIPLVLSHLNPQFANSDKFKIELLEIDQLAVPVAKNGKIPPSGDVISPLN